MIEPIDTTQRQTVLTACRYYLDLASDRFQQPFANIDIHFDLWGKTAGMYLSRNRQRCLRFNPFIFARYFDENLAETVPHEVAHYVTDCVYGLRHIRPHGPEWKQVMQCFGAPARRTFSYDLSGIPQRQYRRYAYRCECRTHELTAIRHNRVLQGTMQYFCRHCGSLLLPANHIEKVLA